MGLVSAHRSEADHAPHQEGVGKAVEDREYFRPFSAQRAPLGGFFMISPAFPLLSDEEETGEDGAQRCNH